MAAMNESASLGKYRADFDRALDEIAEQKIVARIWKHDHTVWKPEPEEITNRLGWLHTVEAMNESVEELEGFADRVRAEGYTQTLLLGMGGSSLAPEVFRKTFGVREGYLDLGVLDSTDPGAVLGQAERLDPRRTLFVVSTKSGTTVETLSLFKFFYNRVAESLGEEGAGEHFVAITDPGSKLALLAEKHRFRATFLNDPNIGGRYSALSYFGLVPAALVGVDLRLLLDRATRMICSKEPHVNVRNNPAARMGAIIGELANRGRDKLTLVASPEVSSFGDWVEQLIAESTGKEGRGILPLVGETLEPPDVYGDDRWFAHLQMEGHKNNDAAIKALEDAGHPVVRLGLGDLYDLGGQFFLWEMATAVAGHRLGINPFDQPNVDAAKVLARRMVDEYVKKGALPEAEPRLTGEGISVYGDAKGASPAEALKAFLAKGKPGAYVAIHAYVKPSLETYAALQALRHRLRDSLRLAVTVGYGPRFLHSTGQLHKGDAGRGYFIQFTADDRKDAPIPEEAGAAASSITFGVLKAAQAMGDREALREAGRSVIRLHLGEDVIAGLQYLAKAF